MEGADGYHRGAAADPKEDRINSHATDLNKRYTSVYPNIRMVKTIRVSEEYHRWLKANKEDDETMEETLRRLTRGPDPGFVAGLLSAEEASEMKEVVKDSMDGDTDRKQRARDAFADDS